MRKNPSRSWLQANGPKGHVLAHITPAEGKFLEKNLGASGSVNRKTKLKQYFLSGLLGGSKPPGPSTTTSELDPDVKKFRGKVFDKAGEVMDRGYEGYEGDRLAGMSDDTSAAHGGVRGMQGKGQTAFGEAAGVGKDVSGYAPEQVGAESFLGGKGVDQYMSPHTKNVIGGMQQQAMNTMQKQRGALQSQHQMAGAGMGSRGALENAAMMGQVQQDLGQRVSGALEGSYAQAAGMKESDMKRAQDAARYNQEAGLAGADVRLRGAGTQIAGTEAGRAAGYTDAGMLSKVGADIEGRDQNQLDIDYGDFVEERDWDKGNTMFASNVLGGAPSGTRTTMTGGRGGQGSKLGGAIGAGLTGWAATGNPYVGLAAGGASLLS